MRILLFFPLFIATTYAGIIQQIDPNQSSSYLFWKKLEGKSADVIYPGVLEVQAQFISNLLDHYSTLVGLSYDNPRPKKFPLVLRREMALPNGFVTLGPRRSEWYVSANISPIIGSLNFLQSLAIHEYRHIVQYDFMLQSTNKFAYTLFGDFGLSLAIGLGVPSWYLEGDAVWAETYYTDGGRGRSPRFSARLKAMLLNDQAPSYDEFIAGTYRTKRPNQYVFGYYLVSRAYEIYGEDVWKKILASVAKFSFNPYALTNAFESVTGEDFERFYEQTLTDLKFEWRKDQIPKNNDQYSEKLYPKVDGSSLYYFKKDLNNFWAIYRYGKKQAIKELDINPRFSKVDIKDGIVAYTQILPDQRYGFRTYSDLFVYDIDKNETRKILNNARVYHPEISPDKDRILVTEQMPNTQWQLSIYNFKGERLKNIKLSDKTVSEATWYSNDTLVILAKDIVGKSSIHLYTLNNDAERKVFGPIRNNFYSLTAHQKSQSVYFEADATGSVQIFKLQLNGSQARLFRCTNEKIAAYTPSVSGEKIFYSTEQADGIDLKSRNINCISTTRDNTFEVNDVTTNPSDNYLNKSPVEIQSPEKLKNFKNTSKSYNEFKDELTPHSWGIISGRGIEASITGNNILNSLGYNFGVGQSTEEKQPYGFLNINLTKYYPIFSLNLDYRQREDTNTLTNVKSNWTEAEYGLTTVIPFRYKNGFYNNYFELTAGYSQLKYTEDISAKTYELSDDSLNIVTTEFQAYSLKDRRLREIYPSYGIFYNAVYKKANASETTSFSSEVFYQNINVYLPGFFDNNGFKLSAYQEKQSKGFNNYRFSPINETLTEYVLSRGFNYTYIDKYTKGSIEYAAPLWNTDFNLAGWVFLRRIYGKVFFDHTKVELLRFTNNLNSTGAELIFETKFFRILDLDIGVRNSYKLDPNESSYDVFFTTNATF